MTRKALGRGLEALIPKVAVTEAPQPSRVERGAVPVDRIRPNPWQPRTTTDPLKMDELVRSIQTRGVLEPLLLRKVGETYELVAGERRLRAAQRVGLTEVPAIIVELDDIGSLEVALIENLQREDLNPVDEARAYHVLAEEFGKTHEQIADQVGKERSTVTNLLRLLKLPAEVLDHVAADRLTMGHARAILSLSKPQDQLRWARRALKEEWSVRETERRVAAFLKPQSAASGAAGSAEGRDPHLARVEEAVRRRVGTETHLHMYKSGGGRLELGFADQDDLERILHLLGVQVH